MYSARSFTDPLEFKIAVEPWLMQREAANNLMIALLGMLTGEHMETGSPVLRAVYAHDEIVGVALRTGDDRALLCTELPEEAVDPLLASLRSVRPQITRLTCPDRTAALLAERCGKKTALRMALGIYECSAVTEPAPVPGAYRAATPADLPVLIQWSQDFSSEALNSTAPWSAEAVQAETKRLLKRVMDGKIGLWCDPVPVSQVYNAASTPNGARVTGVYTPPLLRGRGYASACVAALTKDLLAGGKRFVFLFTDLANPTSNKIYQDIGYRFLCSSVDVDLAD